MRPRRRLDVLVTAFVGFVASSYFVGHSLAASPTLIRYQARLVDAAGVPLTGVHDLEFAIYTLENGGAELWTEALPPVDLGAGTVDLFLGEVVAITPAAIDASEAWLQVTVDGSILDPRQRLVSVPYSLVTDRLGTMTLSEIQVDIDARIGLHAADSAAHHVPAPRTVRFVVDPGGSGDFTTIQAAISAVPADTMILVRSGLYELSAPLVIDRTRIHLVGEQTTRIQAVTGAAPQINLIEITNAFGITFENFDIGGDEDTRPYKTTLQIQNSEDVLLRNNTIRAGVTGFQTILIDAGSQNVVLSNNRRIDNQANDIAVVSAASFVRIENNTFKGNPAGGWITVTGTETVINGNSFVTGQSIVIEGNHNVVTSNVINGLTIELHGDRNVVGNNFLQAADNGPASGKILVFATANDNILTGNITLDFGGSPTLVQDNGTNTILRGNLGNTDKN